MAQEKGSVEVILGRGGPLASVEQSYLKLLKLLCIEAHHKISVAVLPKPSHRPRSSRNILFHSSLFYSGGCFVQLHVNLCCRRLISGTLPPTDYLRCLEQNGTWSINSNMLSSMVELITWSYFLSCYLHCSICKCMSRPCMLWTGEGWIVFKSMSSGQPSFMFLFFTHVWRCMLAPLSRCIGKEL